MRGVLRSWRVPPRRAVQSYPLSKGVCVCVCASEAAVDNGKTAGMDEREEARMAHPRRPPARDAKVAAEEEGAA